MLNNIIFWYRENLLMFQIVSFFISVILLFLSVYFIAKTNIIDKKVNEFIDILGKADISRRRLLKAWKQIQKRLKIGSEAQLKLAIIEADKILDEILKKSGYQGENMSDRLKQITPAQISNIEEIWQAHKIRNRIVHEPDFSISRNEAKNILEIYKKAFQESGLID